MAERVPNTTTVDINSTSFDTVTNTPTMHATTNISISATLRYTAAFTAPNTTNKVTGVLIYVVTAPGTTITFTLQENTVDTAATVTVNISDITTNDWVYVRFPTPYQFTATTAGYYRFKIVGSGGTSTAAADAAGTAYCYKAVIDQTGVLGASDTLSHIGQYHNGTPNPVTVTVTGTTAAFGAYGDTALIVQRTLGNAMNIGNGGILKWDTAASSTMTMKGNICINSGGEFRMGNSGTPIPAAYIAKYIIDSNVSGDHGIKQFTGGKLIVNGAYTPTYRKSKLASGTGTTASPLVLVDPVDWSVGDEIIVTATGNAATNYNETELKFIRTKNSSTSYTLSDTVGGAESGFTNTHTTNATVLHLTRNCIITGITTVKGWYMHNVDTDTTGTRHNINGLRGEYSGNATSGKEGWRVGVAGSVATINDLVLYKPIVNGLYLITSKAAQTFNYIFIVKSTSAAAQGAITCSGVVNATFNDFASVGNNRMGSNFTTSYNLTFNRCIFNANNIVGTATGSGGVIVTTASAVFNDCSINANRINGVQLSSSGSSTAFNDCHIGDYGSNAIDVQTVVDTVTVALFTNCMFGSPTLISNYLSLSTGSEIRFHKLNQTNNNHYWYTNSGVAQATGTSLTDTTVRTPGSLAVRINPQEAVNGFSWSFNIPAKAFSVVIFNGRFIKNTAFGTDVATVSLYLPGSSVAAATQTLTNTYIETVGAVWDSVVLSAANTSATDGLATIVVNAKSATANAYIYVDDLYNAGDTITSTDKVTGLDTWDNGKPITIISPQVLSTTEIWSYPVSALTSSGTIGYLLKKVLTVGKYLALK